LVRSRRSGNAGRQQSPPTESDLGRRPESVAGKPRFSRTPVRGVISRNGGATNGGRTASATFQKLPILPGDRGPEDFFQVGVPARPFGTFRSPRGIRFSDLGRPNWPMFHLRQRTGPVCPGGGKVELAPASYGTFVADGIQGVSHGLSMVAPRKPGTACAMIARAHAAGGSRFHSTITNCRLFVLVPIGPRAGTRYWYLLPARARRRQGPTGPRAVFAGAGRARGSQRNSGRGRLPHSNRHVGVLRRAASGPGGTRMGNSVPGDRRVLLARGLAIGERRGGPVRAEAR